MSKKLTSILSLILAIVMLASIFASCANQNNGDETQGESTVGSTESQGSGSDSTEASEGSTSKSDETTEAITESEPESESITEDSTESSEKEEVTTDPDEKTESTSKTDDGDKTETTTKANSEEETENGNKVANKNDAVIQLANGLANGVQAYFTDGSRTHFSLQNLEMTMNYSRSNANKQLVESIKNTKGTAYIQNTMDVFVRMNSGNVYYASSSTGSAEVNLYRFGYYYYEAFFEFQNFASEKYEIKDPTKIQAQPQTSKLNQIEISDDNGNPAFVIIDPEDSNTARDPWFSITKKFNFDTSKNDALVFVAKALGDTTGVTIYADFGLGYKEGQTTTVKFIGDGEYHTYYVPLDSIGGFESAKALTGIRIDPNGTAGGGLAIESMVIGGSIDVPSNLSINRHFHVYSDKMHHAVQFAVTEKTENIAEVGMLTEISADTVSKLIIVTSDDKTYTSLDAGFSWDDVVAVGFDVKDAGIFGFILPDDEIAGKIHVELTDGVYVIKQTRTPSAEGVEGVIIPSIDTTKKDKYDNYVHAEGVKNNGNDFYLGQRVYTDENHDFSEFLKETGFERHPINPKTVNVSSSSDGASFGGYDAMRGIYYFNIATPVGGFYTPYNNPQKNYRVNFMIRSDIDRDIYVMSVGSGGLLECAVLMDENDMLLPVPIEVIKNFSEATGERNLYNISDPTFSEAILCLSLKKNVRQQYSIVNLYQNWGNYPLKQLSQIPFHCPYYHMSTGVTETNCLLPWFGTVSVTKTFGSTLPDFRSMSAPYWKGQPQHNSCGHHTWLRYTDTEGITYSVESQINTITSYGPTYAEIVWENLSDDGKIKVTYTHMEMPQTDENRTYYTMEYEFLDDLTIESFKENFRFYTVTDNDSKDAYRKLGYLNAENKSVVTDANHDESLSPEYVLGDKSPYFSLFMMPDWNRESTSIEGYANLAFLVYNSEFIIGGEKQTPTFLVKNPKDTVYVTLDIDGTVEFKEGDKITINAIVMPWGSQQYEDGIIDHEAVPANHEYTEIVGEDENGNPIYYMDKNVRDVRENTLLNPLTAASETDEIIESPFLPKIRSKDGKTAEFTLSGGHNNVAVRVYGFDMLTAPKVEEFVNGEWVEYEFSSKNNPDINGYYHYYDGYMVNYDADGTYSYSFVTTMDHGAPRKFRVTADKAFTGWPEEILPEGNEDLLKLYFDYEELFKVVQVDNRMYGTPVMGGESDEDPYVSIYAKPDSEFSEAYSTLFTDDENKEATGQYLVIKYRVPTTNSESLSYLEIFASTFTNQATESGSFIHTLTADGNWHVDVIDLSKAGLKSYTMDDDGNYCAKLLRIDFYNGTFQYADTHMDIAYVGVESDIGKICELENGKLETLGYYAGKAISKIEVETGLVLTNNYIHPSSGYTESEEKFGAYLDSMNGATLQLSSGTEVGGIKTITGATVTKELSFSVRGWCAVNGGVSKYVYSTDGGKTWKLCGGAWGISNEAVITAAAKKAGGDGYMFDDKSASMVGGAFQGAGLIFDLSDHVGETVNVILAAIPQNDENTLALLFYFTNIECVATSVLDSESEYTESRLGFVSRTDFIGDLKVENAASSTTSFGIFATPYYADSNNQLLVKGWCALEGGVSKYVWTPDKGKTWYDLTGTPINAGDAIMNSAQITLGANFSDLEGSRTNGSFQINALIIDLSAYKDSTEPLDIFLCAVSASNPDEIVILFQFTNVSAQPAA